MEWIKIEDKLPEAGIYLVISEGNPLIGFFYGDIWLSSESDRRIEVEYWMPLPEPPKD